MSETAEAVEGAVAAAEAGAVERNQATVEAASVAGTSDNGRYVTLGAGSGGAEAGEAAVGASASARAGDARAAADPAGAGPWGEPYLTNEEALRELAARGSGVGPLLTKRAYRAAKRAFDIVASGAAVALLLVPGAALCAVICAKSPGAGPIYSQWRVGRVARDGSFRAFRMYKFRSMVPGADGMLAGLQGANEATGPMFKIKEDPRVIPGVGTFIRKHSIDELPQLVNVLKGDMSLIGPRPGLPREVALYDERAMGRLVVKPGCGGAWQTSGRSDVGFGRMVEMDLAYIEGRGLRQDLSLVLGTLRAMLSGDGAA